MKKESIKRIAREMYFGGKCGLEEREVDNEIDRLYKAEKEDKLRDRENLPKRLKHQAVDEDSKSEIPFYRER